MGRISDYERLQIESAMPRKEAIDPGIGLFLMPGTENAWSVFQAAVEPAMQRNCLNAKGAELVFSSSSSLVEVAQEVQRAEVIVADVTGWNADVMYVLGLAHGIGRCPLLIGREPVALSFNLQVLRCIEYDMSKEALYELREQLTRAIRVFLIASRATRSG